MNFCQAKSGKELNRFFFQWIYEPYYPIYEWQYAVKESTGSHFLELDVKQVQDRASPLYNTVFRMPIDIQVSYPDTTKEIFVIMDSLKKQRFSLPLKGVPDLVLFDPENWILKEDSLVNIGTEQARIDNRFINGLESVSPNPFNRAAGILYSLETNCMVNLKIFNLKGQQVSTLIQERQVRGNHVVTWNPEKLTSGIYIIRGAIGNRRYCRKIVLSR
jgi:hypothetical protein